EREPRRCEDLVDGAEVRQCGLRRPFVQEGAEVVRERQGAAVPAGSHTGTAPGEGRSSGVPVGVAEGTCGHGVEVDGAAGYLSETGSVPGAAGDGDARVAQVDVEEAVSALVGGRDERTVEGVGEGAPGFASGEGPAVRGVVRDECRGRALCGEDPVSHVRGRLAGLAKDADSVEVGFDGTGHLQIVGGETRERLPFGPSTATSGATPVVPQAHGKIERLGDRRGKGVGVHDCRVILSVASSGISSQRVTTTSCTCQLVSAMHSDASATRSVPAPGSAGTRKASMWRTCPMSLVRTPASATQGRAWSAPRIVAMSSWGA